jgi:peptidase E
MLNLWKKHKLYKNFKDAYNAGIILSGVSAGAVCWFDWILTDSLGNGYKPLKGMNFISGSCTPHASKKNRLKEFETSIKNKKIPSGIAIDDEVAVLFINGKANSVCTSKKNRSAYFINKNNRILLDDHIKKSYE